MRMNGPSLTGELCPRAEKTRTYSFSLLDMVVSAKNTSQHQNLIAEMNDNHDHVVIISSLAEGV